MIGEGECYSLKLMAKDWSDLKFLAMLAVKKRKSWLIIEEQLLIYEVSWLENENYCLKSIARWEKYFIFFAANCEWIYLEVGFNFRLWGWWE